MRSVSLCILHSTLPLLLGGLVYLAYRPSHLLMFHWFDALGAGPLVRLVRDLLQSMNIELPTWVVYNFPDGCWVWSLTSVCTWIWRRIDSWESGLWISSSVLLGVASECAQHYGIISGVADLYDGLCMVCAWILAYYWCLDREHKT